MKQKDKEWAVLLCIAGVVLLLSVIFMFVFRRNSLSYSLSSKNFLESVLNRFQPSDNGVPNNDSQDNTTSPVLTLVGGYKDEIEFKNDSICDLYISPSGSMKKVSSPASLFEDTDQSKGIYNPGDRAVYFEMGSVSGTIGDLSIPDGTKYYLAEYDEYPLGYPYTEGWQYLGTPVRFFILNNKIYVISGAMLMSAAEDPGFGYITSETTNTDGEVDYTQAKSLKKSNVVILNSADIDFINNNTYSGLAYPDNLEGPSEYFFTSSKGANFVVNTSRISGSLPSGYKEIDEYQNLKIYVNSRMSYLIKDREGFFLTIYLIGPTFTMEDYSKMEITGDSPLINWKDGSQTSVSMYDSTYGTCESASDATVGFVYEKVNSESMVESGLIGDIVVYEKKNSASDVFTKKIYSSDYNSSDELWKYNSMTEDDNGPLTYDQYMLYHPVIYIKDAYGNFIRYTNSNFMMVGGCAKPAIYLYPETKIDISVKVVPNGKLTFTNPLYNNGWSIQADSDGNLLNHVDNKLYDYLWWDSYTYKLSVPNEGYVIPKAEVSSFLDTKLGAMNLNKKEISQFKEYWVSKIQSEDSSYIFITFLFNTDVDQIAQLKISPRPDNVFRVFMLYKPVSNLYNISPLPIKSVNREGFVAVEWGGAKI